MYPMNLSIERMYQGLKNNEFTLHYQPKYDLFLSRITGVEALIRWNQDGIGLIPPACFIPLAEDNGFINELGDWILRSAINQAVKWRLAGYRVTVAINISPCQIKDNKQVTEFILKLDSFLQEAQALVSDIQLEVTEGVAVTPAGLTWVEAIKSRCIPIVIDDFGTGFSSLAYLKNLGAHTLKIDKAFVDDAPSSLSDCLLLSAMVEIGHSFGMIVVAEGVEEEEQVDFLKVIKCDVIQGYFFSKPLVPEDVELLFTECPNPFCIDQKVNEGLPVVVANKNESLN